MNNIFQWNSNSIIKSYLNDTRLQLPEHGIFNQLKDKFGNWRVLDIGIGTGRTTLHLAHLVKEYIGIDYSQGMIEKCRKEFPDLANKGALRVGNVCSMKEFETGYFDFVLFSFNGIDYVSHQDRILAFKEILRVIKPGGQLVFSTHNLLYIDKLYSIQLKNNLRYSLYQCYRFFRLIFANGLPGKYRNKPFAIINDGAHHFSLKTYYIKPGIQLDQLKESGFAEIKLFSHKTGLEINLDKIDEIKGESWIYYWCRIPEKNVIVANPG